MAEAIDILLVGGDELKDLERELALSGQLTRRIADPSALNDATRTVIPRGIAMVFDPDGAMAPAPDIPCIAMARNGDLATRISAVRQGFRGFLAAPWRGSALAEEIDRLSRADHDEPYKVLVVDDSPAMTATYAAMLAHKGMAVAELNEPSEFLKAVESFGPELIVLDLYMPDYSGVELASVLRQQVEHVDLPIIYLSSETRVPEQVAAMMRGGDDFIVKPPKADYLVATIAARIARARQKRDLLAIDPMSGALNRRTFLMRLDSELASQSRNGNSAALAILDIDHFKRVNDTYGHLTGDVVIKSFARFLMRRLRRSDVVGRFGGEEFMVLFPDTGVDQAWEILDRLRGEFANIRHPAGDREITVTFSGGIKSLAGLGDAAKALKATDDALYKAKHNGRNRIELA